MKDYIKPMLYSEEFTPNQFIAGCSYNYTGSSPVKVYCVNTGYITVFTSSLSCDYQRSAFTSTTEAASFFSSLFQWGSDVNETTNGNGTTTSSWTNDQRTAAGNEVRNGFTLYYNDTIKVGNNSSGTTHAGYALDYLDALEAGKVNS